MATREEKENEMMALLEEAEKAGILSDELQKEKDKQEENETQEELQKEAVPWPDDFKEEAFRGLAGEVVRAIEPYTEADKNALLINFLIAFGNVVGRQVYTIVNKTKHCLNFDALLIGDTSTGRKGTSWDPIFELFNRVDPQWAKNCNKSGLVSGEGLAYHVRDPIYKKETNRKTHAVETVLVDEGVEDKRLMVVEGEFASVLRVMQREGNTLSPAIRQAWDGKNLQGLQKNNAIKATEPHISIIGHITPEELDRYLADVDLFNGFANRFLFVCIQSNKLLPEGPEIPDAIYNDLVLKVNDVLDWVRHLKQEERKFKRNNEAEAIWAEAYKDLRHAKKGIIGKVLGRAEAQTLRLSMLYAVLDKSKEIRPEHIISALAIWERCKQSVEYFFGDDEEEDPIKIKILEGLKKRPMSQTEINSEIFQRHVNAEIISKALGELSKEHKIICDKQATKGRAKKIWSIVVKKAN
jgi:hypothetical protein